MTTSDGNPATDPVGDINRVHQASSTSRESAEKRLIAELEHGKPSADERGRRSAEQLCAQMADCFDRHQNNPQLRYNSTTEAAMEETRKIMSGDVVTTRYDSAADMFSSLDG